MLNHHTPDPARAAWLARRSLDARPAGLFDADRVARDADAIREADRSLAAEEAERRLAIAVAMSAANAAERRRPRRMV